MLWLLRLERQQKILHIRNPCSNPFRIRIFLFLSYSFWNWNDKYITFMHSWSPLENHTRFHNKYTWFQTKRAQTPYLMGRHIPILLQYKKKGGTPPPPPPPRRKRNYMYPWGHEIKVVANSTKTKQNQRKKTRTKTNEEIIVCYVSYAETAWNGPRSTNF